MKYEIVFIATLEDNQIVYGNVTVESLPEAVAYIRRMTGKTLESFTVAKQFEIPEGTEPLPDALHNYRNPQ